MIEDLFDRLDKFMSCKGLNDNQMTIQAELSVGSLGKQRKGARGLSSESIAKILHSYKELDANWLLTSEGTMLKSDEHQVLEHTQESNRKLIPFFDGIVEAGTTIVANMEGACPSEMVDAGDFFQDATAVMQVHGDSMYPDYEPGSIIALKEVFNKRLIMFGQDYVIETSEYRVIKRLQKSDDKTCWLACSSNSEVWEQGTLKGRLIHEPFDVPVDEVKHLYLVLGQMQRKHSNRIIFGK